MEGNVAELERQYQRLLSDYQAGILDEATFVAEVDRLQFQDNWGRYWMLGAQSGAWHYYDGQAWHQADPADADKLPFMDDQGRYWQKGIKSGEWYYYDATASEWVKPGEGDPLSPSSNAAEPWQTANAADPAAYGYGAQHNTQTYAEAGATPQFDTQLYQDDDGRYWALGAKTNQWYFYDESGWHPANEFVTMPTPPANQPYYGGQQQGQVLYQNAHDSQATQVYHTQPQYPQQAQQPYPVQQGSAPNQPQPAQAYVSTDQADYYSAPYANPAQAPTNQPPPQTQAQPGFTANAPIEGTAQPLSGEQSAGSMPSPPDGSSQSGSWYYFDGKQWLKYSSGEPAEDQPPDPSLIVEQETTAAKTRPESPSEPVVAELFADDEPPVEIVDVEVITVLEAEPDPEPRPIASAPPAPKATPVPAPKPQPEPKPPETVIPRRSDEVRPRRSRTSSSEMAVVRPAQPEFNERPPRRRAASVPTRSTSPKPRTRTTSDPNKPVTPRKKSTAHEPTIIIPTSSAASNISATSSTETRRPTKPAPLDQRRARENTIPMEPVPLPGASPEPLPVSGQHRQVTQAMPVIKRGSGVTPTPARSSQPAQPRVAQRARQVTEEKSLPALPEPTPASTPKQPQPEPQQKQGYTFGDVLRSFPNTLWTIAGGIAVLIIFAFIIIGFMSIFSDGSTEGDAVAAGQSPTPTLSAELAPNATPTPGPTTANSAEPLATPTAVSLTWFSEPDLDITIKYPENWEVRADEVQSVFSPSIEGLNPEEFKDTSLRIGLPDSESSEIADLLTAVLDLFPSDAETLNEGTISIASQTWTSTQIRFEDDQLGGQGIATLAVTSRDGVGYYLVAVAPSQEWNAVQPTFQGMINSFKFGAEEILAQATADATSAAFSGADAETEESDAETDSDDEAEETIAASPKATPTPEAAATPLVYSIQSGDTLLGIAVKFGVDMELLALENGIENPEGLQLDQELVIPFTAEELAAYNAGTGGSSTAPAEVSAASDDEASPTKSATETEAADVAEAAVEESDTASSEALVEAETEAAPSESGPAAPVSGRIVYPAFKPGQNLFDIWMVDLATGEQTPIAGNASQPAFNRDGTLLAYRSWDRGTRGIFFRDFVGGRGGIVTRFVEDGLPTWAPDGYSFAFSSRKEGDRVPRVYIGNQLGEDPFSLAFQGEYVSNFPDGKLAVKGCTPSGDCGIFVMGPRGGGEQKISGEAGDTAPAVSPDGNKVAFMSSGRGGRNWEIWVMNADGSNVVRLTENGNNDGLPTWSPDGQSIAYVSDAGGLWGVWAMNADGSNQRKLFDMKGAPDGKVLHDEPNSRGWLEERISWAP